MKIAILAPFHPFRVGLSHLNTILYKELRKKNCEVKAFNFTTLYPSILFPGKNQLVDNSNQDDECSSIPVLSSINPLSYKKTANKINEYRPDVLIIPYWMSFLAPAFGSVVAFLDKEIKVVAWVHNALPHERRFFDVPFAKYFFRKCDGFLVMSDFVAQELLSLRSDAKIIKIEHPIFEQFAILESRQKACELLKVDFNKKNILFFGLIRDYKGLDLIIQAMDYLDDSYQLIIAGESYVDFSKYQSLIDNAKYPRNISVFEQYIPDEKVPVFFGASDILVLPYRSATQSGVLPLAYQLEKPIVSTNVGALGDLINKAETGIVVETATSQSIAQGIETYFAEEDKQKYIRNIRQEKERLSWSSFSDRLLDFFNHEMLKD